MLLILTDVFDSHANAVEKMLKEKSIDYFRFNLDVESLKNTLISFDRAVWRIQTSSMNVMSTEFSCVWCRRPFVELTLQEKKDESVDFKIWKNEWNKTLLGLYNSIKNIPWLNPVRKAYKGENKYYQMEIASKVGFNMPETLITNDKKQLESFLEKNPKSLFKLMAQEIYDIGNEEYKGLYTNVISKEDIEAFSDVEENPIVLQEYIEKAYEVRYTVVGNEHYVCKIDSQCSKKANTDWRRYDIANTPHYRIDPPENIRNAVTNMLEILELEYGALDFIVTPNNEWIFLEINCMGQWLWIEQLTGMKISQGITNWIEKHV